MGFDKYYLDEPKALLANIKAHGIEFMDKYKKASALIGPSDSVWLVENWIDNTYGKVKVQLLLAVKLGKDSDLVERIEAKIARGYDFKTSYEAGFKEMVLFSDYASN